MNIKNKNDEKYKEKPLIELAKLILADERKAMNFNDIYNRVADLKGLSEEERQAKISQFYTDLNVDGSFVTTGANIWGLKGWYKKERLKKPSAIRTWPKRIKESPLPITGDPDFDDLEVDVDVDELSMMEEYDDFEDFDDLEEDDYDRIDEER